MKEKRRGDVLKILEAFQTCPDKSQNVQSWIVPLFPDY
jgi:hypothetical protein